MNIKGYVFLFFSLFWHYLDWGYLVYHQFGETEKLKYNH